MLKYQDAVLNLFANFDVIPATVSLFIDPATKWVRIVVVVHLRPAHAALRSGRIGGLSCIFVVLSARGKSQHSQRNEKQEYCFHKERKFI